MDFDMDSGVKTKTRKRIKVDFERAPLGERLKAKILNGFFVKNVVWYIFRLILLIGISFVILYPSISKIFCSFMSKTDFDDVTVVLLSRNPTLEQYKYIITENHYVKAVIDTFIISFTVAFVQTVVCSLIAYGFAKFKFKGNGFLFALVVLTMVIPNDALAFVMQMHFQNSDVLGIVLHFFGILPSRSLYNTYIPLYVLSLTGLGFKNGLFIYMLRQFFRGVPDELEESAYIDGSGTFKTFVKIILPLAIPMMVTVFILAFSWQWTDNYYIKVFFDAREKSFMLVKSVSDTIPTSLSGREGFTNYQTYQLAVRGTATMLAIAPLILMYIFCQNFLVQGIERSGIVG